jgi:hypothetical protein
MQMTTDLDTRRAEALVRIARAAIGAGIGRALPFPASVLVKEIGVTAADAWMLYDVYNVYYDEPPTPELLIELLDNAGLGVAGGLAVYGGLRVVQGALANLFKSVPKVGWLLNGAMTGASTFVLGLLWQMFLEESARIETIPTASQSPIYEEAVAGGLGGADSPFRSRQGREPGMITTERPDGKPGVLIPKPNYELVRSTIMDVLRGEDTTRLQNLIDAVEQVSDQLDKSARWYVNTIKLDLEAHGVIERVPNRSPQELRLVDAS